MELAGLEYPMAEYTFNSCDFHWVVKLHKYTISNVLLSGSFKRAPQMLFSCVRLASLQWKLICSILVSVPLQLLLKRLSPDLVGADQPL